MLKKSYQKRLSIQRKSNPLGPESAVITSPFWVMNGIIKRTGTLGRYLSVGSTALREASSSLLQEEESMCMCLVLMQPVM